MIRSIIAAAFLLALSNALFAEVKIANIKARYSVLGPERASLEAQVGDEIYFTFLVTGLKTDADGMFNVDLRIKVTDESGKVGYEAKKLLKDPDTFGGACLRCYSFVSFGAKSARGNHTVSIVASDKLSGESAAFERVVKCLEPAFSIVTPKFSYDPDGKTAASLTNVNGQRVYYSLVAAHFDRSRKKIDMTMSMQAYDDKGKAIVPNPTILDKVEDDAETVEKQETMTFNGSVSFNRVGTFRIRFTITDNLNKKTATLEIPVTVLD